MADNSSWLHNLHPHYSAMLARRRMAQAFYAGENVAQFLVQHRSAEGLSQFVERQTLTHADPYMASVIDGLAGMLYERPVTRDFGSLGNYEQDGTPAHTMWTDCTGQGESLLSTMHTAAIELLLGNEVWALVDASETGMPRVRVWSALAVQDWIETDAGITEALVKETAYERASVQDAPEPVDRWVVYTPDNWRRYKETDDGPELVDEQPYADDNRAYVSRNGGLPTSPVTRTVAPFKRYVGGQLASGARALFSTKSEVQSLQRACSFPKLVVDAGETEYTEIVDALRKGSNVMRHDPQHSGQHGFISPDMSGVSVAREALQQDVEAYNATAFRLFEAEGKAAMTATEALLSRSSGLASCLQLLAGAMTEFEASILFLAEQCLSDRPAEWTSRVEYPTDYRSALPDASDDASTGTGEG